MAKKKTEQKKNADAIDKELEVDLFDDSGNEISENSEEEVVETSALIEVEEIEEEIRKDYKYLKARILEQHNNIYQIEFLGISHGFLNYLSSKLIDEKGVNYSAYKETSLSPPVLTVVTDGTISIQKILKNTCKGMKSNISSLKKAIAGSIN